MSTSEHLPIRYGFDHHPANWCFPAGGSWITGWVETEEAGGLADVRAWIDGEIFLGVLGLPFESADTAVPGRHRFAFLVEAGRGSRRLRLEAWNARCGWIDFFQTPIIGTTTAATRRTGEEWAGLLPRFVRGMAQKSGERISKLADETVRAALAKPLNLVPAPPFFGTLETPTIDGYVREGKVLVAGWLAHQTQPIRKMTARVIGAPEAVLPYGLQRSDVGEQFPGLVDGDHPQFAGLVDLPRVTVEPVLLLVFAETGDGARQLVFTRRFLPWERKQASTTGRGLTGWRQLRAGWALMLAVHRHGVPWWDLNNLFAAVQAPGGVQRAARMVAKGDFAESTPLSLYLSSFEDHEIRVMPAQDRPRCPRSDGLNLLFVLHGDFYCASALHVLALADQLTGQGHVCIAAVPERLDMLLDHEAPSCHGILHTNAMQGVTFPNGRGPDIVHAWSTRECVRVVAERLKQVHGDARLVVHLEDNDSQILAATLRCSIEDLARLPEAELDRLVSPDMSHPRKGARFLRTADGVTIVVDTLAAFVPPGIPIQLITPAADSRYFYPRPRPNEFHRLVDPAGAATILCYNGNVHPANAAEMREFYAAVLQLNRTGLPARLIRTGYDHVDFLGPLAAEVAPFVCDLGSVQRHRHVAPLMALADLFVQPGSDNEFNACRLPSKLPEYFALGRPVILPRTNLGRIARHGVDAYVLERADCAHIVGAVKTLRADPVLYEALSRGASEFARRQFSWERSAGALTDFYAKIMAPTVETPR
jgi:glycosyltransferase involved in cell wall biosynthesis